ncbi:unnamed protein product [Symbiodinium microadriaticum]|nr:unnamed protein product [Symbiodinium microadriaticum]
MAYSNPWWCTGCSRWCKAKADFCGGCGAHWQQVSYAQPSTTRATTSPRRRARSPRQKPWGPQPAKGKGGGQPVAKGKGGKSEPPSDAAPPYAVAPWRPPSGQLASAELPRTDDSTVQELLGAIRSTMTQQGLPTQVEEAMAKLEQNTGRLVTKSIHSQTTAMGAARKQLQNIKESKRSQEASWVEFLNSTVTALEKGSQRFQETMADLDAKEIEAAKKLAAARKAIRALAGDKEPPETVGSADEDGDSDVELMEDTAVVDLPSGEDTKIMQATWQRILSVALVWTSPGGHQSLLDYVVYPRLWRPGAVTLPTPDLQDLHSGRDHDPVALELNITYQSTRPHDSLHVDVAALSTAQGQAVARRVLESVPMIPWSVDSTCHVDLVHRHLHVQLRELPPAPPRARNPALTSATVELVRRKRHMQRCLAVVRTRSKNLVLWAPAWRDGGRTARGDAARIRNMHRLELHRLDMFRQARQALTQAMQRDKADFTRRAYQQAREAGPREFAFKLRAVLRTGRRFRAPPLVPVLKVEGDAKVGRPAVLDAFAEHFAAPERASPVGLQQLSATNARRGPAIQLDGERIPSLVQLAGSFAKLKSGKAPGISRLPSELFKLAPCASARIFWPVMMKSIIRDPFPMQWRGGAAVAVPKPGKASDELQGFRSVLLLEPTAKAVQTAYRPMLHDVFMRLRTGVHYGGIAGAPISLPAACAKAHFLHLDKAKKCGGAVFIDCKAAYYSVAREVLTATPEQLADDSWARSRASLFFDEASQQDAFIQALRAHNAPGELQQFPELAAILRGQLANTWFTGRTDSAVAMRAESGTVPGSPAADLLFGVVFQKFLARVNALLAEGHWAAFVDFTNEGEDPPSTPTWADDVCVLFQVDRADLLETALQTILTAVVKAMKYQGLQANLGPGKTEVVLVAHGPQSRAVRRRLLAATEPQVNFVCEGTVCSVRLVPSYTHLGCVIQADACDLPAIQYREAQAQAMYGPLRKKLLNNQYLSEKEKLLLLKSRVITSYMHGAGLHALRTQREQEKFADVVTRFHRGAFRPIVGVSSQGYTNLEIASILGLALPEELLAVARARALADLSRARLMPVLRCFEADGHWWKLACEAARVVGILPSSATALTEVVQDLPSARMVSVACRRYLRRQCAARSFDRAQLVPRAEPSDVQVMAAQGITDVGPPMYKDFGAATLVGDITATRRVVMPGTFLWRHVFSDPGDGPARGLFPLLCSRIDLAPWSALPVKKPLNP